MMAGAAAAAPVTGETYIYRLVNGYNKESVGELRYQVDRVEADRYSVSVTPDSTAAGVMRTEVYTKDGNWLQHPLASHGQRVEHVFASTYPAYAFPLEAGKSWSVRVNATVPGTSRVRRVRVDGTVMGNERIRVPAGEFDTIKVRRLVYPDDAQGFLLETKIVEFDWYAPALGRSVRSETRSSHVDTSQCGFRGPCEIRGDWDVLELMRAGGK
jgi:hypothetical protein